MEKLFEQLKVYLNMDTEISFKEFESYYNQVHQFLQEKFDELTKEELVKAKYITSIIQSNAVSRAKRKEVPSKQAKKYKKIAERCSIWAGGANYKLLQSGLTQQQIDEAEEALAESI